VLNEEAKAERLARDDGGDFRDELEFDAGLGGGWGGKEQSAQTQHDRQPMLESSL
jgi:hypothetical protein